MFYKYNEELDCYYCALILYAPTKERFDSNNRQNHLGWVWHDEPPQEYNDWKESQNNLINPAN